MNTYQLSLPGPTECDPEVLQALLHPTLPHHGNLWMEIYRQVIQRLKQVYQTQNSVYILPCSGSGGVDAVFTSLGAKKGIVLDNGTFGNRLVAIARRHLADVCAIHKGPGEAFIPEEIERELEKKDYDLLAVVHGETSTGMLNPLDDLIDICRRKNLLLIVDAISTLGGVPLHVDAQGIDFCISSSQKALGGVPGLATVAVSEKGWEAMPPEEEIHGWYLNLKTWAFYEREWADWHPYPITLPVHLFFVLNKALELLVQEGLEARWARHQQVAQDLHAELEKLGISLLIADHAQRLPTVTAAVLPQGFASADLQTYLREQYHIMIAGGIGPLRGSVFRVGHMGYSAQPWLVKRVIAGIQSFLSSS